MSRNFTPELNQVKTNSPRRTWLFLAAFVFASAFGAITNTAFAQLSGTKNIPGDFATLTAAASALTAQGVGAGGVVFELGTSYNPASETYPIVLPEATGVSISNKITIRPSSAVVSLITISSASAQTININKGDYYVIDGRPGGAGTSRLLEIANTNATGAAVQLTNDARNNSLTYLQFRGQAGGATGGVVTLVPGTDANNAAGVSGNAFSFNKFYSSSPNFAGNLFYSAGSTNAAYRNSSNSISDNEFDNFSRNAILVEATNQGNGDVWSIVNNDFYNSTLVSTVASAQIGINFSAGANSSGITISGNAIGGTAVDCGGSSWKNNANNEIRGISFNANSASQNFITNNVIQNIEQQNSAATNLSGIMVDGGTVSSTRLQITGNTIGHTSDASKGLIGTGQNLNGIIIVGTAKSDLNIANNLVANLTQNGAVAASLIRGIAKLGQANSSYIVSNEVRDLKSTASLNNDGTSTSILNSTAVLGIAFSTNLNQSSSDNKIDQNLVFNLEDSSPNDVAGKVVGIAVSAAVGFNYSGSVARNKVYGLFNHGNSSVTRTTAGLFYGGGSGWVFSNNYVSLTNGAFTDPVTLIGLYDVNGTGRVLKLYNNSFYIGGSTTGTSYSYCYARFLKTTVEIYNNVFFNERTGGVSQLAIANANSVNGDGVATDNWVAGASDYNVYVSGTATTIAHWVDGSTPSPTNLADWQASSGCDASSYSNTSNIWTSANMFTDAANGDLTYKNTGTAAWFVNGKGVAGSKIGNLNIDFHGNARGTTFGFGIDIGADELTPAVQPGQITRVISGPGVYDFNFGGRKLASVNVTTQGTLATLSLRYFSGENPVNPIANSEYFNVHWDFTTNGGASGFKFTPTFFYDDALRGTVTSESDATMLVSRSSTCTNWAAQTSTPTVASNQIVAAPQSVVGSFTGTISSALLDDFLPSALNASVNTNFVDLSWVQGGADSYEIQYSANASFPSVLTGAVTVSAASSPNQLILDQGSYKWRLRVICGTDTSDYFNGPDFTVSTVLVSCFTPQNLSAVQQASPNESNVDLSWTHPLPANVINYTVQYSTNANFPSVLSGSVTITTSNTNVSLLGLATNNYKWRVRANCTGGRGSSAYVDGPVFAASTPPPCDAPTGLSAIQNVSGTTFSWAAAGGASNYTLEYSTNPAFPGDMNGATSVTLTGTSRTIVLSAGDYYWHVRTNCGIVSSSYTSVQNFTVVTPPVSCGTPTPVSAIQQGAPNDDKVVFTFSHPFPSFVNNYTIQYSTNPSFPAVSNGSVTTVVTSSPATLTLVPGEYKWRVRANCGSGSSAYVDGAPFSVVGTNVNCGTPSSLMVSQAANPNDYSVTLSWSAGASAVNYLLQYSSNPNFPTDLTGAVSVTQSSLSKALSLTQGSYKWRVATLCSNGNSSNFVDGAPFTVNDPFPTCNAPTPAASLTYNSSITSIKFSWTIPSGTINYFQIEYGIGNYNSIVTGAGNTQNRYGPISQTGTYQWRIKSVCPTGSSVYANGNDFTVNALREGGEEFAQTILDNANPFVVNAYPNPVRDRLTVDYLTLSTENAHVALIDLNGRVLYQNNVETVEGLNSFEIDAISFAEGVYVLRLVQGDNSSHTRVIVK